MTRLCARHFAVADAVVTGFRQYAARWAMTAANGSRSSGGKAGRDVAVDPERKRDDVGEGAAVKDKRTAMRELLEPHAEELVAKVVEMAKAGDADGAAHLHRPAHPAGQGTGGTGYSAIG